MDFYIVDEDYISYLQDYERKHRNGITRVPNVRYADRNKFSFGAVLIINDISYYVAVSSFKTKPLVVRSTYEPSAFRAR